MYVCMYVCMDIWFSRKQCLNSEQRTSHTTGDVEDEREGFPRGQAKAQQQQYQSSDAHQHGGREHRMGEEVQVLTLHVRDHAN